MLELIAIVIAALCLFGGSTEAGVFFVALGVLAAAWRISRAEDVARKQAKELVGLESQLHNATTLAERAIRIAAEANNLITAMKASGATVATPPPAATVTTAVEETSKREVPFYIKEEPVPAPPAAEKPVAPPIIEEPIAPPVQEETPVPSAKTPEPAPVLPKAAPVEPPRPATPPQPPPPRWISEPRPVPPAPVFSTVSKPPKPAKERVHSVFAMEEVLGTNWLNKIGVILVVLGVASFGIIKLGQLGPVGRVGVSLAVGLALLVGGIYLERNPRYRILGRTGIGGGWALLFFTAYAMGHVDAMRVISSDLTDSVLMLMVAGIMVMHTLRYRSQLVTGFAFLLAYSTIALSHDTSYSLAAGAILAASIVTIIVKMSWFELDIFAILASYANHFYWLYQVLGPQGAQGRPFGEFIPSAALLIFYWAAFRFSYVARKVTTVAEENLSTVSALLNPILLLFVMKFQSAHPEYAFYALLVLGALEFTIGQLSFVKQRRMAFVVLTLIGSALMLAAVPFRFSGQNTAILWLIGAEVLLFAGIFTPEPLFRRIGLSIGYLVALHVLVTEAPALLQARHANSGVPAIAAGAVLLAMAVIFYGNTLLLRARWPQHFTNETEDLLLTFSSYPGVLTLALGCWALFVYDSAAVAFSIAMLAIALIGYRVKSPHLQLQTVLLAAAAGLRTLMANTHWDDPRHLLPRILSLSVVAALFYVTARFVQHNQTADQRALRAIFAAAGSVFVAALLFTEVPQAWQGLAFALFAWSLIEAGSLLHYAPLRWHTHLLAIVAVFRAAGYNLADTPTFHSVHIGVFMVLPVVAVLYLLAHRGAALYPAGSSIVRTAYSWAGTSLALWLIAQSVDQHYVAAAWMVYALGLTIVARWRHWTAPAWQAFLIGCMSAIHAGVVNLLMTSPRAHDPIRLWVTLAVIASLYLVSEFLRLPEKWHQQEFERFHSWLATALTGTLLWYELTPVAIAVAWAILGLVLYEYGALRKATQFRWQAYVVLLASFGRIFFANLTAGAAGDFLSSRMLTVLPIAAIYFYVYAREVRTTQRARTLTPASLFAYLGSGAVMAVLYFQFPEEWVVTAWAALVMALLALALLVHQEVFVQQAILVSFAVLGRGMIHNLFGGSYFTGSDWQGRFFVVGSAVALLFAALPLAFAWRRTTAQVTGRRSILTLLAHHVEQPIFFIAVALLTTMLALKMDHGMVTLAWGVEAVLIFIAALLVKERSYRLTGMGLLLLCVAKIIIVDVWRLAPRDKYVTFIVLGASLILVSFLYSKYSETIRQYL